MKIIYYMVWWKEWPDVRMAGFDVVVEDSSTKRERIVNCQFLVCLAFHRIFTTATRRGVRQMHNPTINAAHNKKHSKPLHIGRI